MKKEYKEIELPLGTTLEDAIKELRSKDESHCANFNGNMIYSDETTDQTYMRAIGKTKAERDAHVAKVFKDRERAKKEHEEAIPEKTQEWIDKGKEILDEKYMSLWTECVPIRLRDLYQGMELRCCLDIVKPLNEGCDMQEAINIIDSQGHSGMSHGLVRSMVRSFCDRGEEFYKVTQY